MLLPWLRKFLTSLNFLFLDIDLLFVNIFNMHICFSVNRKLALKMTVKLNSRQCDGFIAIVTKIYTIAHFLFFIFHMWKTNVCQFDTESSAHI